MNAYRKTTLAARRRSCKLKGTAKVEGRSLTEAGGGPLQHGVGVALAGQPEE